MRRGWREARMKKRETEKQEAKRVEGGVRKGWRQE